MLFVSQQQCRSCEGANLREVLAFGPTPLADRLLTTPQPDPQMSVPLTLVFCPDCTLLQILETVAADVLFDEDYPYFSSVSPSLLEHFRASALALIASQQLGPESQVIEAASNDGYMLKHFVQRGIPVLGIDPAGAPTEAARSQGIPTLQAFFTEPLAHQLRAQRPEGADLFLANNVLAHVADLNGFVRGIRTLLRPEGLAVIEVPYVVDLVDKCEFDTIYHQHLCTFSVTALDRLFSRHGLHLSDVQRTTIHGGSLRLFVKIQRGQSPVVGQLINDEAHRGFGDLGTYLNFAARADQIRARLRDLLWSIRSKGRIVGYGAAAKAATLLSYAGVDGQLIDYIVDKNAFKHGRFMGGNCLPIVPPARLLEDMPPYVLILAWNFAHEIMSEQRQYAARGGRFVVPIPEPKLVGSA